MSDASSSYAMLGRGRGGEEGERKGRERREEGQPYAIQCRIDLLPEHCAVCVGVCECVGVGGGGCGYVGVLTDFKYIVLKNLLNLVVAWWCDWI